MFYQQKHVQKESQRKSAFNLKLDIVRLRATVHQQKPGNKNSVTAPVERRRVHHRFQGFQVCETENVEKTRKKQMHIPTLKKKYAFFTGGAPNF